jgi:hypothetical protein
MTGRLSMGPSCISSGKFRHVFAASNFFLMTRPVFAAYKVRG